MRITRATFLVGGSMFVASGCSEPSSAPTTIAARMVETLTFGGIQSYALGVQSSFNQGLMQLDQFAYYIIGPNEGLDFDAWVAETRRLDASLENEGPISFQIALRGLPGIYNPDYPAINADPDLRDGRLVNRPVADRYLARIRALDPEIVAALFNPVALLEASRHRLLNRAIFVHLLVQHEPLYDGVSIPSSHVAHELAKLSSISPDSLDAWVDATGYPVGELVLCLARVEALFPERTFSRELFETALPLAVSRLPQRVK